MAANLYPLSPVMVSAPSREAVCAETTHHLIAELGLRRILTVRNQPDEPECHGSHGLLALRGIASALNDNPDWPVLFLEDDIRFDVALTHQMLPSLLTLAAHDPVTLYLPDAGDTDAVIPGIDFYPHELHAAIRSGAPLVPTTFPVPRIDRWWGTQAMLLPASFCRRLLAWTFRPETPLDRMIRALLLHGPETLYGVSPNLVQHTGLPSLSCPPAPIHQSLTFGRGRVEQAVA